MIEVRVSSATLPKHHWVALCWALAVWSGCVLVLHAVGMTAPGWLPTLSAIVVADGFLLAAAFRFVHWRSLPETGLLAQTFGTALAALLLPLSTVAVPGGTGDSSIPVLARALVLVSVFPLLAARRYVTRMDVVRGIVKAVVVAALVYLLAVGADTATASLVTEFLVVAGWLMLADRALEHENAFAVVMCLLGLGEATRICELALPGVFGGLSAGFDVAAGVLLAAIFFADLREVWRAERKSAGEMASDLVRTRAMLDSVSSSQRDRMHDARSVVAGVIGAAQLLADRPDPDLSRLMVAELTRLAGVLDVESAERACAFDLRSAADPVLRLHAVDNPVLATDVEPVRVVGRPQAVAAALDNLLRNCRVHAPCAPVRVWTHQNADHVTLVVEDDGPGIPPAEREFVLRRGVRGSRPGGPGSGLGLHNVVKAVGEDGVRIAAAPSGGTRVELRLPVASEVFA